MRIDYFNPAHPVSVVVHDAKESLEGIIQGLEDHLIHETDFTREKIKSSACALRYIMVMLSNASAQAEALERRPIAS